ncbi:ATP synthase subunit I [Alkalibacillus haloalkaliphilus]|uniref:ATP synthase protein I n=1 Tax=Alkalibacillus haloalkaliphilus TaxID=94136 RepID=A0A511W0N4_9BACI|nr:ATP synthase subunit I [Alkalibacillus haloalkaliphilus]GEN44271.1 ATP synthase protein I [Alkalibacillus haloalkaliphilus]
MTYYKIMVNRQRMWMLFLLAISVLGWGFTDYESIFAGLIFGQVVGFFNLYLLQKKINVVGEKAANNQAAKSLGALSRFAGAILLVVVVLRFPEYFHLIAAIVGLMTPYIVIMIDFIFHHKETTTTKRGE